METWSVERYGVYGAFSGGLPYTRNQSCTHAPWPIDFLSIVEKHSYRANKRSKHSKHARRAARQVSAWPPLCTIAALSG